MKVSHAAVKSLTDAVSVVRTLEQFSFQAASKNVLWLVCLYVSLTVCLDVCLYVPLTFTAASHKVLVKTTKARMYCVVALCETLKLAHQTLVNNIPQMNALQQPQHHHH